METKSFFKLISKKTTTHRCLPSYVVLFILCNIIFATLVAPISATAKLSHESKQYKSQFQEDYQSSIQLTKELQRLKIKYLPLIESLKKAQQHQVLAQQQKKIAEALVQQKKTTKLIQTSAKKAQKSRLKSKQGQANNSQQAQKINWSKVLKEINAAQQFANKSFTALSAKKHPTALQEKAGKHIQKAIELLTPPSKEKKDKDKKEQEKKDKKDKEKKDKEDQKKKEDQKEDKKDKEDQKEQEQQKDTKRKQGQKKMNPQEAKSELSRINRDQKEAKENIKKQLGLRNRAPIAVEKDW